MDYKFLLVCVPLLLTGFIISYFFLKPYLKDKNTGLLILRWYPILALCALLLLIVASYLQKGPDYFEEGITQLRKSEYVKSKVGDFETYTYNNLPKETNPVKFNIQLSGNGVDLFLTCTMRYIDKKWKLTHIKSDSLRLQKE
jgi:hypothetical protein